MNAKIASAFILLVRGRDAREPRSSSNGATIASRSRCPRQYRASGVQHQAEPLQGEQRRGLPEVGDRDRRAREQDAHPRAGREGAARGHPAERPGQEPGRLVLPRPDLPAAGQARFRRDTALTQAEQLAPDCAKDIGDLPPECLGRAGQGAAASSRRRRTPTPRSPSTGRRARSIAARRSRTTSAPSILNDKGQPDSAAYYFGQAVGASRQHDRHDRVRSPQPLGVQPGRAAAQRQEVRSGRQGLRAVPQVGPERQRGQARPGRGIPRHGQDEQAQALEKELVARAVAPRRAAAGGGGAGRHRRPDERRGQPVQRQEVRRCGDGIREGRGGGALQSRRALQPERTPISRSRTGPSCWPPRRSWWRSSR